jgi:hypothetical protein
LRKACYGVPHCLIAAAPDKHVADERAAGRREVNASGTEPYRAPPSYGGARMVSITHHREYDQRYASPL